MSNRAEIIVALKNSISAESRRAGRDMAALGREADRALKDFARLEAQHERTRRAELQAALAGADHAGKLKLLEAELARTTQGTQRYYQVLAQYNRAQQQAARAAEQAARAQRAQGSAAQASGGGVGALAGQLGLAGGVAGAAALAFNEARKAFDLRGELQSTQRSFATLVGSQDLASRKIQEATAFGDKYRIKQTEINEVLNSSAMLMRTSSAATETQLSSLSRLAALNPAEGVKGAAFALKELASGDVTSIVERFNLSRDAAYEMRDAIKAGQDPFVALDQQLTKMGVTSEVLSNRLKGIAGAQNEAAKAGEDFGLALGRLVEGPGQALLAWQAQVARGATVVADRLAESVGITTGSEGYRQQAAAFADTTKAGQAYIATQDALAKASKETQSAVAGQAAQLAQAREGYANAIAVAGQWAATKGTESEGYQQSMAAARAYASQIEVLAGSLQTNIATSERGIASQRAAGGAMGEVTRAAAEQRTALEQTAAQQATAAAKSEELKLAQERVTTEAKAAADALLSMGEAGEREAARLAQSSSDIDQAKAAYYRLAAAARDAKAAQEGKAAMADWAAGERTGGAPSAKAEQAEARRRAELAKQQQAIQAAAAAQRKALADTPGQLAIAREELAKLAKGTPEYINKQTEVLQLERRLAEERKAAATSGSKSAASRAAEAEKANLALLDEAGRLDALRAKLGRLKDGSVEYNETLKEIRDLEAKIADEKERQVKAAVDARLAAIDDRTKRREEEKQLASARRVLGSGRTSEEQKTAARDAIERIELERQKRQLDIAGKVKDAGGAAAALPTAPALPALPAVPTGAALPALPPSAVAPSAGATAVALTVAIRVQLDSREIAAALAVSAPSSVQVQIERGLSGGMGRVIPGLGGLP